jgi:hypothetical protein
MVEGGTSKLEVGQTRSVAKNRSANLRQQIRDELAMIEPLDVLEREHLTDALAWVDSGVGLVRIAKPATPPSISCPISQ